MSDSILARTFPLGRRQLDLIRVTFQKEHFPWPKYFIAACFLPGPAGRLEAMLWTPRPRIPTRRRRLPSASAIRRHDAQQSSISSCESASSARRFRFFDLIFAARDRAKASTTKAAVSKTTCAQASIFSPQNFPAGRFCSQDSVSVRGLGLRVGCEDERVSDLIGLGTSGEFRSLSYLA